MVSRWDYRLLNPRHLFCGLRRKAGVRDIILPLLLGISIGLLIGQLLSAESSNYNNEYTVTINHTEELKQDDLFFLRCVVVINPLTKNPLKYVEAIRDTHGRDCNQTVFYTNSKKVMKKITDQTVFLIDSSSTADRWSVLSHVLDHSAEVPAQWTVILDEQVFLHVGNLRVALRKFNSNEAVLLGRVINSNSLLSFFFPFSRERLALHGGVVLSKSAIASLVSCRSSPFPYSSESAIFRCAQENSVAIRDPVDEDGLPLFNYNDLKSLVPVTFAQRITSKSRCCSDHAISFGQQTYKELRLAHYATNKLMVFGRGGSVVTNSTYAIDPNRLNRKTTKKPEKKPEKKEQKQPVKAAEKKEVKKAVQPKKEEKKAKSA